MTMLSQNAVRRRKNMTLPLVLHGVFPAVDVKLAEPLEGEVRSVPSILRMLETSCPRLFLKFERLSSLRKCRQMPDRSGASELRRRIAVLPISPAFLAPLFAAPRFGNESFTIPDEFGGENAVRRQYGTAEAFNGTPLSVHLSGVRHNRGDLGSASNGRV